jgi:hypothetical protein
MCLIVKKGTKKIVLKKDTIVWKVVLKPNANDNTVGAAYYNYKYVRGKLCKTRICKVRKTLEIRPCDYTELKYLIDHVAQKRCSRARDVVREGYAEAYGSGFHFFTTKTRALQSYNECRRSSEAIARFVIPAGSTIILSGNDAGITNRIIYSPE